MIKNIKGNTLLENIVAVSVLCIYILSFIALTGNLFYQQSISKKFVIMNGIMQDSVEEMLNKKYTDIAVGILEDKVQGFDRKITVSQDEVNLKEINILLSGPKGEMSLTVEKGLDIN